MRVVRGERGCAAVAVVGGREASGGGRVTAWRDLAPTRAQGRVLARIGRERGRALPPMTRGEAAEVIAERFVASPSAHEASRLAQAARARANGDRS